MTFLEVWVAEEEVIAGACRGCMAPVGIQGFVDGVSDLLHLVVEGHYSLLEQFIAGHLVTDVEIASLQSSRRIRRLWDCGENGDDIFQVNVNNGLTCDPRLTVVWIVGGGREMRNCR